MKKTIYGLLLLTVIFLPSYAAAQQGIYKIDGYIVNTADYTVPPATPITSSTIEVYEQGGTNPGETLAAIFSCTNPQQALSNPFTVNTPYYCFMGAQTAYDVLVSADSRKVRRVISEQSVQTKGVYRLTDFGARDTSDPADANADSAYALMSAMAYIGTRGEQGGKLIVPNGVYKVSNPNSAALLPVVIPPGLTLEGLNGKGSFGSSRIQLELNNQTLFKIGNNTDRVTIRDLSLIGFVCSQGNCTGSAGSKAIYGEIGDTKASHFFLASSINIQGFEEAFTFSGAPGSANNGQFGSARIENANVSALYPIRLNAQNAELLVANSVLLTYKHPSNNEEASVRIDKAGAVTLDKVYGGTAQRTVGNKPLAFVLVKGRHSVIRLNDCQSENVTYNFLYDYVPPTNDIKPPIIFDGVGFGDLVVFKGNVNFTSIGSSYASNGVQFWGRMKNGASTDSEIYSYGDRFSELTNDLKSCPPAPGITRIHTPPPSGNGDFQILQDDDIEPYSSSLDRNVCRRDFYLYNSPPEPNLPDEKNRVVIRTGQRPYSSGDSETATATHSQTALEITAPPVFDPNLSGRPGFDRFKAWGYRIERNPALRSLDFIGNQKPPRFADGNFSSFRFNGGVYPTDDAVYELGNSGKRWSLVRGVEVIAGDMILSDKVTGKELYRIYEDEKFIYFSDYRTGKVMMRLGLDGNLYLAGKIVENASPENAARPKPPAQTKKAPPKKRKAIRRK